jgi:hypothetical protein
MINKEEKPKWISRVVYSYTGDTLETSDGLINAMAADGYELRFDQPVAPAMRLMRFRLIEPTKGEARQG